MPCTWTAAQTTQRERESVVGLLEEHGEGLEDGALDLTVVLTMAAENGARLVTTSSFPVMSEEELHDALLAHVRQLPAGSTAFSRQSSGPDATGEPLQVGASGGRP